MFFAWQVNFTLTEHGHSSVPYWLAVLVTVLVSTVGVDAVLVRDIVHANACHYTPLHTTAHHCTAMPDTLLLASRALVTTNGRHERAPCGQGRG